MNGSCEIPEPQLCGCCEGTATETPEPIFNRPGLSAVSYRVGTHVTFKASLLAALSSSNAPALAALRTRDDSDFSIALLDAWAVSLDVLAFYQERIVNESYLRTAVDTASVMDLAQLVGYKPSPGVAASAYLAFTLSSAVGSPDPVLIPAGSRVQSIPGPGQTPQVFETSADLNARIALNAIPARTTLPWGLSPGNTSIWLQGTANNINVGDGILFVGQSLYAGAAASPPASATGAADFHFVTSVTLDSGSGNTLVQWDQPLNWPASGDNTAYVYIFRKRAALFGVQAPDARTLSATHHNNLSSLTGWPTAGNDWVFRDGYAAGSSQISLDNSYPGAAPAGSGSPEWAVLDLPDRTALYQITAAVDFGPALFTLTSKTTQLTLANGQILISPTSSTVGPATDELLAAFVSKTRSTTVFIQSDLMTPAAPPAIVWSYDGTYQRQTGLLQPVEGKSLEILTGQQLSSGQIVAISGKRLRLQVSFGNSAADPLAGFVPDGATAPLPLSNGQIFLVDAFPPQAVPGGSEELWSVITTDGAAGTLEIAPSNVLLIPADKNDAVVGESATINQASVLGASVQLTFSPQLARIYDRSTVAVNANVIAATNGETMNEILGSGDATNDALQFTLKQSPLTYVPAPVGQGAVSTLQVWVNNLRWHEVDNFLDSLSSDRVFITESDAAANVTVQFGDGQQGARTSTGQMNIRAAYRKGIGAAGNVAAGQLSQPLDRPQGLKSVLNPDPAGGGDDPDTADDARTSAPLHVLTLDRVVSLEDYQNYALAFAGIAKALATWTWSGRMRAVFLTVAGANGAVFEPDDLTIQYLLTALRTSGNPFVPIQIESYRPVLFEIGANIRIDTTNYDPKLVLAQVSTSLTTAFSFAQRQFGQGVAQSEVIALIQGTPGVIAVELTGFNRQGEPPPVGVALQAVLRAAAPAQGQDGTIQAAEMLILDPASLGNLEVWS